MSSPEHPDDPSADAIRRRSVRSFVLRTGRATAAQQRAMTELWPLYGVEFTGQSLEPVQLFGRDAPVMIEIGFGNGEALLEFAKSNPQIDCLGIEVHRPGVGHLLLGVHEAGLKNVRVVCHDAVEVLQRFAAQSISFLHIFFPDPWHKKRHHKRRLIQPSFVALISPLMKGDGLLRLATDWEHYALQMREVLDASADFENVAGSSGFIERPAMRPLTRFERRGHRLGHGVWDMEYRKKT
ncbi:MAG TPA: tRNA (guanosine(46)-N7)-methyltransferase TrmB [Povalibacter sp.]|jgi:tRNA (guanine-N7-)-methyltransferase|nr:tRNA (guanosine(46)-N7)-methyltransferase TrmB [Povalibacter sp.]